MFEFVAGTIFQITQKNCVIETGGVGWNLSISTKTAGALSGKKEARVYTHLSLGSSDRANMELFGFYSPEEREMFRLLIDVSGIGPKAAISILSALSPEELSMCVLAGDAKALTAAQGIGMKGAQKIILELKDKLAKNASLAPSAAVAPQGGTPSDFTEAINALVVLGYQPQVAASAVRAVAEQAKDLQDMIRLALKSMGDK